MLFLLALFGFCFGLGFCLDSCWTSVSSQSALIVSHGGDWDLSNPYDSMGAYERAFAAGSNAGKGDFRVSKDGYGMVVHSSPFQWYESFDCKGKRVEEMSAFEVSHHCNMLGTQWKFLNVSDLLDYTAGKLVTMFDVKNSPADLPHAMASMINNGAANRTFLEVSPKDILSITTLPQFRSIFFVANARSKEDVELVLNNSHLLLPNVFALEYDPHLVPQINLTATNARVHAAGFRTLTATPTQVFPSVEEQVGLFNAGIDIVYTYGTAAGVKARDIVNKQRKVNKPCN